MSCSIASRITGLPVSLHGSTVPALPGAGASLSHPSSLSSQLHFIPRYRATRLGANKLSQEQEAVQGPWVRPGSPSLLEQSHHGQVLLAVLREKQVLVHLLLLTAADVPV